MKTESIRKGMVVGIALLIGIAVCVSVWFFLWKQPSRALPTHESASREPQSVFPTDNKSLTENRNVLQSTPSPDEEPLDRYERVARHAKSNFMSLLSEEALSTPRIQKLLEVMDSPAFRVFLQNKNGTSTRAWLEFMESQGIPVPWNALAEHFRLHFPTGEPEDYELEMRLKMAKLFLSAEPVDLTNPTEAALQRRKVITQFRLKDRRNFGWFFGQFDWEWEGAIQTEREGIESNPAFVWMTNVQRNAASIVAAAETAGVSATEAPASAPSWDLSSVVESPSASLSETEGSRPGMDTPSTDASERSITPKTDDGVTATAVPGFTDVPSAPSTHSTEAGLEAALKAQFSSDRFERAMSTLNQYGPEEGLRRLRENDPEVAKQVEQHRSRGEVPK